MHSEGVNFGVVKGEVMGLVGENGAGKSTLVKIISGFDDGFTGSLKIDGSEVCFRIPGNAQNLGIAITQQELSLVPSMTVAENIFLVGPHMPQLATSRNCPKWQSSFWKKFVFLWRFSLESGQ